jgi:hypothetical protein
MNITPYEIYAIKYATRNVNRPANFVGGDPHDAPMNMDYFVWLVRNAERSIVVDTGFTESMAKKRARTYLRERNRPFAHALRPCRYVRCVSERPLSSAGS